MAYLLPTIADFKTQFLRDFPYATPLVKSGVVGAEATVGVNNAGSVVSPVIVVPGSGLPALVTPVVYGGGGVGATLTATVTSGVLTALTVANPGIGYVTAPYVYLPLFGDNTELSKVTDGDLAKSFTLATAFNITQALLGSQAAFTYAYNLLSAHYLCENVLAGSSGLSGKADWLTKSKSVGNVRESFDIPKRILNSPYLSKLSKTVYGAQFLELMAPQLVGNIVFARGTTQA